MIRNINISHRKLKTLEPLKLDKKVTNTEAMIYVYDHKDKWDHVKDLLKLYYYWDDSEYIADKINTISALIKNSEILNIPELVLPKGLVTVDQTVYGFYMDYIENNINMAVLLSNKNITLDKKLKHLKEIYKLLYKLLSIKELKNNFYLSDIHEGNFIYDLDNKVIKAVDIDSSYINKSYVSASKYLTGNDKILNIPKYTMDYNGVATPIPSKNTTILSFLYMLLNTLSGSSVYRWSKSEFYSYLSFLRKSGMKNEIVDIFEKMYNDSKWGRISEKFIDEIDPNIDYTLFKAHIPTSSTGYYGDYIDVKRRLKYDRTTFNK